MSHPSTEGHWARFGLTLILNDDLGADVTEDRLGARGWQIQLSAVWEFAHTVRAQIDLDMDAGTLHAKYSQHKMKLELQMPCELDCVIQHIAASLSFQRIHSVLYISCAECGKAHDETKSKSSLHIERDESILLSKCLQVGDASRVQGIGKYVATVLCKEGLRVST